MRSITSTDVLVKSSVWSHRLLIDAEKRKDASHKKKEEINKLKIDFNKEYVLEKKINLKKEISIIITRFSNNDCLIYQPIENTHVNQILNKSLIPADIAKDTLGKAQQQAKLIAEKLEYIGTMCVEYFYR